jgi:hypothetical protein
MRNVPDMNFLKSDYSLFSLFPLSVGELRAAFAFQSIRAQPVPLPNKA